MESAHKPQKTFFDLVKETISDLKHPQKWVDYFFHAVQMVISFSSSIGAKSAKTVAKGTTTKRQSIDWQTVVIIIAILFIIAVIFKVV